MAEPNPDAGCRIDVAEDGHGGEETRQRTGTESATDSKRSRVFRDLKEAAKRNESMTFI